MLPSSGFGEFFPWSSCGIYVHGMSYKCHDAVMLFFLVTFALFYWKECRSTIIGEKRPNLEHV